MLGFLKKPFVRSDISAELSRGQLSLLSDFNISRELKARGWREGWEAVLGVDGDTMLQRFVKLGLIEASPYEDYVREHDEIKWCRCLDCRSWCRTKCLHSP
jgi:hypothetical protein